MVAKKIFYLVILHHEEAVLGFELRAAGLLGRHSTT
jgi:hypothetical protein